jgi:AcrR family transcriptional regulator
MARKYELKKRAEKQEETRQRIVEAIVDLHEEVGPASTTIKGIADRAGVQRLNVYRHFPDERSMFEACSAHFMQKHPAPDPTPWMQINDPIQRLRTGITELYDFFARTERMNANVLRDAAKMPELAKVAEPIEEAMHQYALGLIEPWEVSGETRHYLHAAAVHAVLFTTWQSLIREQRLDQSDAVELMVRMITCLASCSHSEADRSGQP